MSYPQFSLLHDSTQFRGPKWPEGLILAGGYQDVTAGLAKSGQLTDYDVEMMIYRTEEILESDSALRPLHSAIETSDTLLHRVSERFLSSAENASRSDIESAFNHFADALSYGIFPVTAEQLPVVAGFIFLREISHHLDVDKILFRRMTDDEQRSSVGGNQAD